MLSDVELGDVRVMYANVSRALLGPVRIIESDGEGDTSGGGRSREYEDVAYKGRPESSIKKNRERSRSTTRH